MFLFFKRTLLILLLTNTSFSLDDYCYKDSTPLCYLEWQKIIIEKLSKSRLSPETRKKLKLEYNFSLEALEYIRKNIDLNNLYRKYEIIEDLSRNNKNLIYHPLEIEAVNKTFEKFGELYIGPEEISIVWEVKLPWAGHWYPKNKKTLFETQDSPLHKLERALKKLGINNQIVKWEEENFSSTSEAWEGLCTAWSIASIKSSEPQNNIYSGGEILKVADQKAILTKIHEKFDFNVFGIFYRGNASTDGTYQDIRPEAFHRIMSVILGKNKKPFIVDDDAATEVWSKPVFKVIWSSSRNPNDERVIDVSAKVYMIKHKNEENDKLTTIWDDSITHNYSYRLIIDPLITENNRYKVLGGEWTGASWEDHPDVVIVPKENGKRGSLNPELENNLKTIEKILGLN